MNQADAAAWVLAVIGVVGSLGAGYSFGRTTFHDQQQQFLSEASAAEATMTASLQGDVDVIRTARTRIAQQPTIDNAQFTQWFAALGQIGKVQGTFALGYIEQVPASQLPSFAATVMADPPLGVQPPGGFVLKPPGARSSYCLMRDVTMHVPANLRLDGPTTAKLTQGLLSFIDPASDECETANGSVLRQAAASGEISVAPLIDVLGQNGFGTASGRRVVASLSGMTPALVLAPVYALPAPVAETLPSVIQPPQVSAPARGPLIGWISSVIDGQTLLVPVGQQRAGLTFELSYRNSAFDNVVLAHLGKPASDAFRTSATLEADGTWTLRITKPTGPAFASAAWGGVGVLLLGLILTAAFILMIRLLVRSRSRALELAEVRRAELQHQALHDELTGLPNRALILDRANLALASAARAGDHVALLLIEVDGFKDISDAHGHRVADELLTLVGIRFASILRESDTVGRVGSDQFVVLAEGAPAATPELIAGRLLEAGGEPFHLDEGHSLRVSMSVGIASGPRPTSDELLRDAGIALHAAKAAGRGRYMLFQPEMHVAARSRVDLDSELRTALAEQQFFLVYQPCFELDTMVVRSCEALLRWRHPERGVVPPMEFIPALEASGFIVDVGRWVLQEACRQAEQWRRGGLALSMAVNVSARQFERAELMDDISSALDTSGLDPRSLVVEITETTLMSDPPSIADRIRSLKELGIRIAVDDFGTGYSSLAYLQQFAVDVLKIDRSFVAAMNQSGQGEVLVHALVQLGQALGLETLAEGIEEERQLLLLRSEHCSSGQGFYFCKPLEPEPLLRFLADRATATGPTAASPSHA